MAEDTYEEVIVTLITGLQQTFQNITEWKIVDDVLTLIPGPPNQALIVINWRHVVGMEIKS